MKAYLLLGVRSCAHVCRRLSDTFCPLSFLAGLTSSCGISSCFLVGITMFNLEYNKILCNPIISPLSAKWKMQRSQLEDAMRVHIERNLRCSRIWVVFYAEALLLWPAHTPITQALRAHFSAKSQSPTDWHLNTLLRSDWHLHMISFCAVN
ncbi:unnamed protein product [Kuraishia capsulata CBS 1993]|uniref:Uncharacterized protein n=1 Tax=Kuraishia capsulata CBS 1993 TaxID=1382522 RepID=W6MHS1_9ASCO|nr:uncharacterized protein KUCA_T00001850001 [Kuraishia capsulata CBS 1993]CDK25879.1 unnamed protein product [Kuraishia capsulata CBS 1993]